MNITKAAITLHFTHNGETASKDIVVSGNNAITLPQLIISLSRVAREADRDISYKIHGKDWRDHTVISGQFFDPISDGELIGLFGEPS